MSSAHSQHARSTKASQAPTPAPLPPLTDDQLPPGFDRDLSWLAFNDRVLQLALDDRTPLLERIKFTAIFSSNLDEFIMKRVGLMRQLADLNQTINNTPAAEHLAAINARIAHLQDLQADCYEHQLKPALAQQGIHIVTYTSLCPDQRTDIDRWYRKNVFPILTPLAVDPGHRFPFISNLSRNLGVLLHDPSADESFFARVKIPNVLPQLIRIPIDQSDADAGPSPTQTEGTFISLLDLIHNNLDDLFPAMRIGEVMPFRVTRNAEVEADDDDPDNLLELVEAKMKQRRFADAVRLEVRQNPSPAILSHVLEDLKLTPADVHQRQGILDYTILFELLTLNRPDLKDRPWSPRTPARLEGDDTDIFEQIRKRDILVHHPYESFEDSAQRFVATAARDPDVLAIKQTIYRTSNDSPFINYLVRAAERGKQVAALVELQARFDESHNVRLARKLEEAGVHVAYGVVGLKTHCKLSLVVRKEQDGIRTYAHIGTGNYHPKTAQLYTDLGLFTCDHAITDDVVELFNLLTGRSLQDNYKQILVAPTTMKQRFLAMIRREAELAQLHAAGKSPTGGRIVAKMNALEDTDITHALYHASRAGVRITLFIRGFCCLQPGIKDISDNITVISVVGRFLEHSRIFHFGNGQSDPIKGLWYMGSADWMHRNLEARVEAITPVSDPLAKQQLARIFEVMHADHRNAWTLNPDGSYTPRTPTGPTEPDAPAALGTFETLMRDHTPPPPPTYHAHEQ